MYCLLLPLALPIIVLLVVMILNTRRVITMCSEVFPRHNDRLVFLTIVTDSSSMFQIVDENMLVRDNSDEKNDAISETSIPPRSSQTHAETKTTTTPLRAQTHPMTSMTPCSKNVIPPQERPSLRPLGARHPSTGATSRISRSLRMPLIPATETLPLSAPPPTLPPHSAQHPAPPAERPLPYPLVHHPPPHPPPGAAPPHWIGP